MLTVFCGFSKPKKLQIKTGTIVYCSAQTVTRIGLLEEIPRSGVQIPCLS
jgi:hypothetical protein